ncbi:MAG: ZapG family protein [Succinivibrio sp.]
MNIYALYVAVFLCGFIVGAIACFMVMAQIYKHKRVKDELLKTKRSAIRAQRTLDRFLKTSLDMVSEIDAAHTQYVQFLKEAAQRIAPLEAEKHEYLSRVRSDEFSSMKKERDQKETPLEVQGTLGEIPTPKVLKSPEVSQDIPKPVHKETNTKDTESEGSDAKESKNQDDDPLKV